MLEIEYKGGNSVVIATKKTRVVIDPKASLVGLKDVTVKDSVVIATEDRFLTEFSDAKLVIEGPGEYGVDDLDIRGIAARRHIDAENQGLQASIYKIGVGDIRIGLLGNIDSSLSDDQLEDLGLVDILIMPIGGGGYTLDATSAATLARSIEAKAIIPIHYEDSALKYEVPQDSLDVFVKEMGVDVESVGSKYKIKQSAALPAATTIIELTRS